MKNTITICLLALSILTLVTACKKKKTSDTDEVGTTAGKGGLATLMVTPKHHSKYIDSCTVYIKYNAINLPAAYDDSIKCISWGGKPVAVFPKMNKGNYYFFGKGWDPAIAQQVVGGRNYKVSTEDTVWIDLAITEGD